MKKTKSHANASSPFINNGDKTWRRTTYSKESNESNEICTTSLFWSIEVKNREACNTPGKLSQVIPTEILIFGCDKHPEPP